MAGGAPSFWWGNPDWRSLSLKPVSWIYGAVARRKLLRTDAPRIEAPVLCIGNFTVGGAGKTPTAIVCAKEAVRRGFRPGIVSRGYGGSYQGVHRVDLQNDTAQLVGDEPLLLAQHAPVMLSPNRLQAAQQLLQDGADFIIMDDGFQSMRLHPDVALLVVDGTRGIGNGCVFPAGPLRAPFLDQMRKADIVLQIGSGARADFIRQQAKEAQRTVLDGRLEPSSQAVIADKKWLAFAGIGNPGKFYGTVEQAGGNVVKNRSFPDHYYYKQADISELQQTALQEGLGLITTAKDYVRLSTMADVDKAFLESLAVLDIDLHILQSDALAQIFDCALSRFKARSGKAAVDAVS